MEAYFIEGLNEIQENLFHGFKVLSTLFSINPNCWRVIGITAPAFAIFKEHGFKKFTE
jgi:hypothetical protein